MNHSGDAAEQIVRMSLEGVEVAARISGAAAKEIALLLLAALKSPENNQAGGGLKLKGKARLESMLKSGKALEIFSVKERDLRTFAREAKRYGIVYCLLRDSKNTPDSLCDIMVKADDAPKINRIVERFQFAAVDQTGAAQSRDGQTDGQAAEPAAEAPGEPAEVAQEAAEINDVDQLLDEFLGDGENRPAPEQMKIEPEAEPEMEPEKSATREATPKEAAQKDAGEAAPEEAAPANPSAALTAESRPSEPISENKNRSARDTFNKPSVKAELREITAARKAPATPTRKEASVSAPVPTPAPVSIPVQADSKVSPKIIHKQPAWDKKPIQTKGR
jgi:hypothetical protein